MDIELIDGDLPARPAYIQGAAQVTQRLRLRLWQWRGEWLLDASAGIDYLTLMEQKPPDTDGVSDLLRAEVLTTPGVSAVEDFAVGFDPASQRLSISGTVLVDGERLALEADVPFAIGGIHNTNGALTLRRRSGGILP